GLRDSLLTAFPQEKLRRELRQKQDFVLDVLPCTSPFEILLLPRHRTKSDLLQHHNLACDVTLLFRFCPIFAPTARGGLRDSLLTAFPDVNLASYHFLLHLMRSFTYNTECHPPSPSTRNSLMNQATLIDQIGGISPTQGIARNFLYALRMNKELGSYFRELSQARMQEIELRLVDLFFQQLGGSTTYKGTSLETLMRNLGLTHREWGVAMGCLLDALEAQGISLPLQNAVMKTITPLEPSALKEKREKLAKGVAIG
ncbi:MAG: hypothetical protein KDD55_05460, partial [Bdellovibrionales bacterium]|nr:hypothetical protein [Bdellovibrionales bacterium]